MDVTTPFADNSGKPNALQSRISSVLASSFADIDVRDSLAILDSRGLQNMAEARRNLQLDVQQELIECNAEIIHDFGLVAEQLKRIGAAIQSLTSNCEEIRKHVVASNRETAPILDEAKAILADKQHVEVKTRLLTAFNEHFNVSDADQDILTSTAEPVGDDFFRVLARVKRIHHDSQVLLGAEDQRLGLEILEQSSRQLNAAYQKLYRWVQREFKTLDLENPKTSHLIRRALRVLAERPALFQNCLDFFAEAREATLSHNFHAALTGVPSNAYHPVLGKAIELSAHDPVRYVSDMLAWAHSSTVSEREALEVLFISQGDEIAKNIQTGMESEPWALLKDNGETTSFDGQKLLSELVDRNLTGVFRLLKQRTEQVLQSHEDATLAYRISNLVLFYCSIFKTLLKPESTCLGILRPISDTGLRNFRSIMRDQVSGLQAELASLPDRLAPPEFLIEALENLQGLMKSYDISIIESDATKRADGFRPVIQEALEPFLVGCETIANRLASPRSHIFSLNCILTTIEALRKDSFALQAADLQTRIVVREESLTGATHEWFLIEAGLQGLLSSMSSISDLNIYYKDPSRLATAAQQLDTFLPTATEDALAYLGQLEDRTVARRIIENAVAAFCEDVQRLQDLLEHADEARLEHVNGDVQDQVLLCHVFHRTTDEIRVLLS